MFNVVIDIVFILRDRLAYIIFMYKYIMYKYISYLNIFSQFILFYNGMKTNTPKSRQKNNSRTAAKKQDRAYCQQHTRSRNFPQLWCNRRAVKRVQNSTEDRGKWINIGGRLNELRHLFSIRCTEWWCSGTSIKQETKENDWRLRGQGVNPFYNSR